MESREMLAQVAGEEAAEDFEKKRMISPAEIACVATIVKDELLARMEESGNYTTLEIHGANRAYTNFMADVIGRMTVELDAFEEEMEEKKPQEGRK